jgi:hypothetical protein
MVGQLNSMKVVFELVGKELLQVVEESKISSKTLGAINYTFLALIAKKDVPELYDDFRPISL